MAESAKPTGPRPPAATPDGGDPSMDDILASIRRILSEDDAVPAMPPGAAPRPSVAAPPAAAPEEGVFDLDASMLVGEEPAAAPQPRSAQPGNEPSGAAVSRPAAVEPTRPPVHTTPVQPPFVAERPPVTPMPSSNDDDLVAPEAAAATANSMSTLRRSIENGRAATVTRGGPSLEDMVREELRPVLKAWLDAHLPEMVERLVRAEIERVVGRTSL